jgi:hypothetical protein
MEQIKAIFAAAILAAAIGAAPQGSIAADERELAANGGYDPMARPVNPLSPGVPSGEPEAELNPELGNLPDTPGAEETFYLCSACHSLAIIKQQRISDARWDYLWNWMIEKQGMPEQDLATKEKILSYLKRHFSSER